MNNEEKILQMLAEMRSEMDARFSKLEAEQARQGGELARQGEQLSKQGERLNEMQDTLTRVAVTQEGVVLPRIQLALEGHSELKREIGTLASKQQVEDLAGDVDIIKRVVTRHSSDISELKKAQ